MCPNYAEATRFSVDVSVSKKSGILGISASFQILSDKKNQDKTRAFLYWVYTIDALSDRDIDCDGEGIFG